MGDLVALLASLSDAEGRLAVAGARDGVRPLGADERARLAAVGLDPADYYRAIAGAAASEPGETPPAAAAAEAAAAAAAAAGRFGDGAALLCSRWAEPSLSISGVESTNGSHAFRKIPRAAAARISLHFVPDQDSEKLQAALREHLERHFAARGGPNRLDLVFRQVSRWWLGDTDSWLYRLAERAVEDVWAAKPLLVREGGSYGGITRFLEEALGAPAIHIPMGQSSDGAHLANERIRLCNLRQGCRVLQRLLALLPTHCPLPMAGTPPDTPPPAA